MARRKTPSERLRALAKLYQQRNKVYGDNYLMSGHLLMALFPKGLTISTPEEFRRLYMFIHMLSKLDRYSRAVARGEGHPDSLDDLSVYSQMTRETDDESD